MNIVFMRKSQHGTQNVKTHNRTTQKTKKMNNTDAMNTKKPGVLTGTIIEGNRSNRETIVRPSVTRQIISHHIL